MLDLPIANVVPTAMWHQRHHIRSVAAEPAEGFMSCDLGILAAFQPTFHLVLLGSSRALPSITAIALCHAL
jgi:hypothetical protein